jgi:hypothetical protein
LFSGRESADSESYFWKPNVVILLAVVLMLLMLFM